VFFRNVAQACNIEDRALRNHRREHFKSHCANGPHSLRTSQPAIETRARVAGREIDVERRPVLRI
jgi:hypothetical protein